MLDRLTRSIVTCRVNPIRHGGDVYYYAVFPTNGVPFMEAPLLREIGCEMVRKMDLEKVERIVVPEAMGLHVGTTLTLMTDIPLNVIRKRKLGNPGECTILQETRHKPKTELYVNGLEPGMKVVIVDDVVSSGGTMRAVLKGLESMNVEVVDVCVVIKRGNPDIGREYRYLVEVEVTDCGRVIVHGPE